MSFNSKNAQKLKETNIPNIHLWQKSFKSFILNGISQPVVQAYSSKRNVPEAVRVRNLGRQVNLFDSPFVAALLPFIALSKIQWFHSPFLALW